MPKYVCVDIGGTIIKYGLATEQGDFLHTGQMVNEVKELGVQQIVTKVAKVVENYKQDYDQEKDIFGLAVATAGIVNPETGTIIYSGASFPGYTGFKLKAALEEATGLTCTVENDVNAAGVGESWLGAGKGANSLFCLMIGTGIGGSLIIEGNLVRGASYSAGEVGYQNIGRGKPWEEICSTKALIQTVAKGKNLKNKKMNGREVFALAKKGDQIARAAVEKTVAAWAVGIANICYIVNPEMVVIGGGITAEKTYLQPLLDKALAAMLLPVVYEHTKVTFTTLGDKVGLLGALRNFLQVNTAAHK